MKGRALRSLARTMRYGRYGCYSDFYLRRVLVAVLTLQQRREKPTTQAIAHCMGLRSKSSISGALKELRRRGYVDFVDTCDGTLRYTEPRLYE